MKKTILTVSLVLVLILAAIWGVARFCNTNSGTILQFSMPEGYSLKRETAASCSILRGKTAVGGIVLTELDPVTVFLPDWGVLQTYFSTYTVPGREMEYMMDRGNSTVNAELIYVDPQTRDSYEIRHTLFEWDGNCYDLWLDENRIGREQQEEFLIALGLTERP